MKVRVKRLRPDAIVPSYAYSGDAGLSMYALEDKTLAPGEQYRFDVGWAMEFDDSCVGLVLDRGSVSRAGLKTMGGVFDSNYRGEFNVQLINISPSPYSIHKGDAIAQLVLTALHTAEIEEVPELSGTLRGERRFGSSGR